MRAVNANCLYISIAALIRSSETRETIAATAHDLSGPLMPQGIPVSVSRLMMHD